MRTVLALAAAAYLFYSLRSLRGTRSVPDDVLITQVRRALERVAEQSASIDIQAREGEVVLSGPIGDRELRRCLGVVRRLPGVRTITNRLRPHAMAA
jgi:osmotically-inducible protein OsmY